MLEKTEANASVFLSPGTKIGRVILKMAFKFFTCCITTQQKVEVKIKIQPFVGFLRANYRL